MSRSNIVNWYVKLVCDFFDDIQIKNVRDSSSGEHGYVRVVILLELIAKAGITGGVIRLDDCEPYSVPTRLGRILGEDDKNMSDALNYFKDSEFLEIIYGNSYGDSWAEIHVPYAKENTRSIKEDSIKKQERRLKARAEAAGLLESKPSETKQYGYYKNISLSTEEYEYIKQYEKWDVAIDRAGLKKHLDINAFNDKFNSDFEACKHYLAVNREDSGAYLV